MAMATNKTPAKAAGKTPQGAAKASAKPSKPVKFATKITQALFGGKKGAPAKATPPEKAAPAGKVTKGKATPAPTPVTTAPAAKAAASKAPTGKGKGRGRAPKFTGVQTTLAGSSLFGTAHTELSGNEVVCREVACEGLATTAGYCRMHYIKNWKKIRRKAGILKEGKLNQYIEELVAKYPDKYIEAILQDLSNDKDFAKVIYDLDLDESEDEFEAEGDDADAVIDTVKRDFEEDSGEGGF